MLGPRQLSDLRREPTVWEAMDSEFETVRWSHEIAAVDLIQPRPHYLQIPDEANAVAVRIPIWFQETARGCLNPIPPVRN